MTRKKPPDLRLPRNPFAHLPPEERQRVLKFLNEHIRVPRTATVYETFSDFDPHKWTMEDFEAMQAGALAREGGKKSRRSTERTDFEIAQEIARQRPTWSGSNKALITKVGKQYDLTYSGARKAMLRAAKRARKTRSPRR